MRVFHLDMNNQQEQCPCEFRHVPAENLRLCGRSSGPGCASLVFDNIKGYTYSRWCGRVIGYVQHWPEGFERHCHCNGCLLTAHNYFTQLVCGLNDPYVDGFSVTYGSPGCRKHIWSYAMRCHDCDSDFMPGFIGGNYCLQNPSDNEGDHGVYVHDPLFNGTCNGEIFQCVQLPEPTSEPLELRICADEPLNEEDALLNFAEFYIQ